MSALAPTLQAFFTDRLMRQKQASPLKMMPVKADMWILGLASVLSVLTIGACVWDTENQQTAEDALALNQSNVATSATDSLFDDVTETAQIDFKHALPEGEFM